MTGRDDRPADRLRLQPDERGGRRAARAGRGLVPDARRRAMGGPGPGLRDALPRARDDRRARRPRRRRDVPPRGPGRDPGRRAAARREPRQGRVPLEGRGERAGGRAGQAGRRRVTRSTSGWRSRRGCCRAAGGDDERRPPRPQRRRDRPRGARRASSGWTSRSARATSRRSSPTGWSSRARPVRPGTRSAPAARSSRRTAGT